MSGLPKELKTDFANNDKEYRHAYADESLNTLIGTQIKVLREQRQLTQQQLASAAEMKQSMISRYEDANYSSWSVSTLKKLADAFDVWLDVRFRSFGEFVSTVDGFSRESLQVPKFDDDPFFKDSPAVAVPTVTVAAASGNEALNTRVVQSNLNSLLLSNVAQPTVNSLVFTGGDVYGLNELLSGRSAPVGLDLENSLFYHMAQVQPSISPLERELNQEAA